MRTFRLSALAVGFCLLTVPTFLSAQAAGQMSRAALSGALQATSGRVIVTMKSPAGLPAMMAPGAPRIPEPVLGAMASGLQSRGVLRKARTLGLIGAVAGEVDEAQLDALLADPEVLLVEPDQLMTLTGTIPAMSSLGAALAQETPWGITRVQAPDAWGVVGTGGGVKVAVMDSGIDSGHPDLSVAGGYSAVSASTAPSAWQDDIGVCNGHGTHVAGTVAGRDNSIGVVGIAPDAALYAIKVFEVINGNCSAWVSSQINGLNWAVSQGIRVVNVSIGGSSSNFAYDLAINNAAAAGTFVVASAGNNGGGVLFPAKYAGSIAVAATNSSNTRPSWSSFGPEVDIAAPGEGINSTMPGGGYGGKSGTSMAAPHVTGVVALLLAQNPGLTLDGIRSKLQAGATDLGATGRDDFYGHGLIQLLPMIGGGSPPPPPPPPPVPLALAVSPASRSTSAVAGTAVGGDSATVTLTGDNSSSAAWSASKKKAWTTLTTANGTGSGKVKWNRSTNGLAAGTYVDTITVSVAGVTPRIVIDTLIVTAAPVPLALTVSPTSRSASAQAGTAAPSDEATVTITGDGSSSAAWSATKKKAWTTLTTANGTGSGTVAWNRITNGLAAGTYVDTITVSVAGVTPRTIIDTLTITSAPVPLALSVSPASRSTSAVAGTAVGGDSATVTLTGDNSSSAAWSASKKKAWTTLTTAGGTGSGTVKWNRSTSGLQAGTYVDTITVSVSGLTPKTVIDTLIITAAPVPLALSVSPASRSGSAQAGASAPADSATVTITGDGSSSAIWTAAKRKAWTVLTTANGTGSGKVRWNRNSAGLAAGTYVDTLTVSVAGVTPRTIIDTLLVTAAPVSPPPPVLTVTVAPSSRLAAIPQGNGWLADSAALQMSGGTADWTVSARKSWTTLNATSGSGAGTIGWRRRLNGLAAGTYVDTITVTFAAAGVSPRTIVDSLIILAVDKANLSKGGGKTKVLDSGNGRRAEAGGDTTTVLVSTTASIGGGAQPPLWTATSSASWITVLKGGGTPSAGEISWVRQVESLTVGRHIDSVVVTLTANPAITGTFVDTVDVVFVPEPVAGVAVDGLFRSGPLNGDQLLLMDAIGNRNGRYDLGDFLAWVEKNKIALSPSTVARLAEVPLIGP